MQPLMLVCCLRETVLLEQQEGTWCVQVRPLQADAAHA
jgi:hypothetical protein